MLNSLNYFMGALYLQKASFGHFNQFISIFRPALRSLSYDKTETITALQTIISKLNRPKIINSNNVFNIILQDEINKIISNIETNDTDKILQNEKNIIFELNSCLELGLIELKKLGLIFEKPELFIVTDFPEPYSRSKISAMTLDADDFELHGVTPGLYMLKSHLNPLYSKSLLLHELIHYAISQKPSGLLARGLEEGLAELLGSLYLTYKVLGKETAINLYLYNRLSSDSSRFWELYLDYTRQAIYLYKIYGLNGIIEIINEGRSLIKSIEKSLFSTSRLSINLQTGTWDDEFNEIIDYVSLIFPRNLILSPFSFYCSQFFTEGKTVDSIAKENSLEYESLEKSVYEIQDNLFLALLSDGKVDFSDCLWLFENNMIRYTIPEYKLS